METLLPSEIARLVLGYLEETECQEAAKLFLETSSYLQECRAVASSGKKFSTKVNGLTLIYIVEKFCSITAIIQDKISKLEECESLKSCRDVTEQLKLLIDVSKGQRFYVNINVPSQTTQTSNGSPVTATNPKKRRHSELNERDRCKRPLRTNILSSDEQNKKNTNEWINVIKHDQANQTSKYVDKDKLNFEEMNINSYQSSVQYSPTISEAESLALPLNSKEQYKPIAEPPKMYSTATDTQELMQYDTREVQTVLDDVESECSADVPVENLSLLTKELIKRTEIQERIAETINKNLSTDTLMIKDASMTETAPGELNTSIMTELNNAIKSIVTATETDPVFTDFFHEVIGPNIEDISPNRNDGQDIEQIKRADDMVNHHVYEYPPSEPNHSPDQLITASSNNNQLPPVVGISTINNRTNFDARNKEIPLDDYNAAAIQSIIDANNFSLDQKYILNQNSTITEICVPEKPRIISVENVSTLQTTSEGSYHKPYIKLMKKSKIRPNLQPPPPPPNVPSDPEITVPTLIVCSKEEIAQYLDPPVVRHSRHQFIPIAPKTLQPPAPEMYLRTVNVPQKNLTTEKSTGIQPLTTPNNQVNSPTKSEIIPQQSQIVLQQPQIISQQSHIILQQPQVISQQIQIIPQKSESITLYGPDNHDTSLLKGMDMPNVCVDDSSTLTGTGLSPFLKLNKATKDHNVDVSYKDLVNDLNITQESINNTNCDLLTKRTPKTLLKSRSKNHRISLSTPRRKSSHVRVLDFNTPTENLNTNYRLNVDADITLVRSSCVSKPLCRTNLFMSPPDQANEKPLETPTASQSSEKLKRASPIPQSDKINSPLPVLKGGWDKVSGVGSIIKNNSPLSDNESPPKKKLAIESNIQQSAQTTWDADLRYSLQETEQLLKINKLSPNTSKNETEQLEKIENTNVEETAEKHDSNSHNEKKKSLDKPLITKTTDKNSSGSILHKSIESKLDSLNSKDTPPEKVVVKKYAKLKTITTKVSGSSKKSLSLDIDSNSKFIDNIEPYHHQHHNLSNMIDLETPRKPDAFGVPPTPRVVSPNHTSVSIPPIMNEESTKVQSFISTPEFPPTPNINLTPQEVSSNAIDASKKNFSAPYYQPSSEAVTQKHKNQEENQVKTSAVKVIEESSKEVFEITEFEVIKENLPKENENRVIKIVASTEIDLSTINEISKEDESKTMNDYSDNDSSSSSSSSTSSSSSSCYSYNRSNTSSRIFSTSKTTSTPIKLNKALPTNVENTVNTDLECSKTNDKIDETSKNIEELSNNQRHVSPVKTFSVKKVNSLFDTSNIETPEKNEALLEELNISETPVGSKNEPEATNLTAKISEMITAQNKRDTTSTLSQNNPQIRPNELSTSKDQMRSELNEKRLRMMNKLNSKPITSTPRQLISRQKDVSIIKKKKSPNLGKTNREQEEQKNSDKNKTTSDDSDEVFEKKKEVKLPTLRKSERNTTKTIRTRQCKPSDKQNTKNVDQKNKAISQTQQKNFTQLSSKNNSENKEQNTSTSTKLDNVGIKENSEKEKVQKTSNVKNIQESVKSKVDMVKRDLFSDEENNDTSNLNAKKLKKSSKNIDEIQQSNPTNVLESLELVPSNKQEKCRKPIEVVPDADVPSRNHLEIVVTHDELVSKKRRRKPNLQNFNFEVRTLNRNNKLMSIQIVATPLEDIFSMIPSNPRSRKKNVTSKPTTSLTKSSINCDNDKGGKIKVNKPVLPSTNSQPLAASSPVCKESVSKIDTKNEAVPGELKLKNEETKNNESNKIKASSVVKDSTNITEQLKSKNLITLDPKILLKQVDINKFLTEVHGPET